jgi:hypothetical protein
MIGHASTYAREKLVQRVCLAYLWDQEELESARFALLFDPRRVDDLDIACKYFWSVRDQPLLDKQTERILLFLDKRIKSAQSIDPPPTNILSTLSLLSCYVETIGRREISWLLAVAPHVSLDHNATYSLRS